MEGSGMDQLMVSVQRMIATYPRTVPFALMASACAAMAKASGFSSVTI